MQGEDLSSRGNAPNPGTLTGVRKTSTCTTSFLGVVLSREMRIKSWTEDHLNPAAHREAMRKAFADPEFPKEFRKLMGDDPAPLGGEELEKATKELPRDKEVVQLYQKLASADPLPAQ